MKASTSNQQKKPVQNKENVGDDEEEIDRFSGVKSRFRNQVEKNLEPKLKNINQSQNTTIVQENYPPSDPLYNPDSYTTDGEQYPVQSYVVRDRHTHQDNKDDKKYKQKTQKKVQKKPQQQHQQILRASHQQIPVQQQNIYQQQPYLGGQQQQPQQQQEMQFEQQYFPPKQQQQQQYSQQPQQIVNPEEIEKLRDDIVQMGRLLKEKPQSGKKQKKQFAYDDDQESLLSEKPTKQGKQEGINITIDNKHEKCLKKLCKKNHILLQENNLLKAERQKNQWELDLKSKENEDLHHKNQQLEFDAQKLEKENLALKLQLEQLKEKEKRCNESHMDIQDHQSQLNQSVHSHRKNKSIHQNQNYQNDNDQNVIEKIVEVPVEVIKHIVVEKIVEKPVEVIKTVEVPVYEDRKQSKRNQSQYEEQQQQYIPPPPQQQQQQQQIQPQIIEKIVEVVKEVPVEKIIEKIVEVPKIEIKEIIREVFVELPARNNNHYYEIPPQIVENPQNQILQDEYNRLLEDYNRIRNSHTDLLDDFKQWRLAKDTQQEECERLQKDNQNLQREFELWRNRSQGAANEDRIQFDRERQQLLREIEDSRQMQNELRIRNDELYEQIQKVTAMNHKKNQELVTHINFLEHHLRSANIIATEAQKLQYEQQQQHQKESQFNLQLQHQMQNEILHKEQGNIEKESHIKELYHEKYESLKNQDYQPQQQQQQYKPYQIEPVVLKQSHEFLGNTLQQQQPQNQTVQIVTSPKNNTISTQPIINPPSSHMQNVQIKHSFARSTSPHIGQQVVVQQLPVISSLQQQQQPLLQSQQKSHHHSLDIAKRSVVIQRNVQLPPHILAQQSIENNNNNNSRNTSPLQLLDEQVRQKYAQPYTQQQQQQQENDIIKNNNNNLNKLSEVGRGYAQIREEEEKEEEKEEQKQDHLPTFNSNSSQKVAQQQQQKSQQNQNINQSNQQQYQQQQLQGLSSQSGPFTLSNSATHRSNLHQTGQNVNNNTQNLLNNNTGLLLSSQNTFQQTQLQQQQTSHINSVVINRSLSPSPSHIVYHPPSLREGIVTSVSPPKKSQQTSQQSSAKYTQQQQFLQPNINNNSMSIQQQLQLNNSGQLSNRIRPPMAAATHISLTQAHTRPQQQYLQQQQSPLNHSFQLQQSGQPQQMQAPQEEILQIGQLNSAEQQARSQKKIKDWCC